MVFKLKSGNKPGFKQMGATEAINSIPESPAKQMTDFSNVTVDGEDASTVVERNRKKREEIKKKKEQEMNDLINNPDQTINKEKWQNHREYKPKKSPAKQAIGGDAGEAIEHYNKWKTSATGGDPKLEKLKAKRIANTKAGKIIKFGEGSNINADKVDSQGRNTWGDKVGKAKKVVKKGAKVAKKVAGKVAKVAGGKALGVAGMMMAKSSKADQPKFPKGSKHYQDPKKKIDFTKTK